jgi:outer membrane lipoprotein-sorting protein
MNKLIKLSFILAISTFCLGLLPTQANAQVLTKILKKMEEHRIAMTSLRSDITMVKRDNNLGEEDVYSGKVQYASVRDKSGKDVDAAVRLDWLKPKQEVISILRKEFTSYDPKARQAFTGRSDSKKVGEKGGGMVKLLANPSRDDIKSKYNVEYLGEEKLSSGIPTWHLKLTPKTKSDYKFLELWIDGNGMPLQGMIVSLNSDTQTIAFANLEKNIILNPKSFIVELPKGVTITKV